MNGLTIWCCYRDGFLNVGSRTDNRDTFFCVAKRKYPKKKPPHAAFILRSEGFERGFRKGYP
jgi:hypothetical protein